MSDSYDPEREYLESGAVVERNGRWKCLECGATGDTVMGIAHVRGCWLHRLVDAVPALSSGNAAALPPPDLLWTLRAKTSDADAKDIDELVGWLRSAETDADREAAISMMLDRFPDLRPEELAMFHGRAYAGDAPYEMLRALLMQVASAPAEERLLRDGLDGIRAELSRRGVGIDALTGIVNKGL